MGGVGRGVWERGSDDSSPRTGDGSELRLQSGPEGDICEKLCPHDAWLKAIHAFVGTGSGPVCWGAQDTPPRNPFPDRLRLPSLEPGKGGGYVGPKRAQTTPTARTPLFEHPNATNRQPPTATNRQSPPTANRQSPPTMVEHMSYTRSFGKTAVLEHFVFSP